MKTLVGIIVLLTVCYISMVSCSCTEETVKSANESCSSEFQTMYEKEKEGPKGYPIVCAYFNDYLKCMDLLIIKCDRKVLFAYKSFQELYTRPPYRCRITPTYSGSQQMTVSGLVLLFGLTNFLLLQIA